MRFSTDELPASDRFDHWREVRGRHLFGVTIEIEPERRADFHGRFSAFAHGPALVTELHASSYRVSRTPADIAHMPGDSLLIGWQVVGPGWVEAGRSRSIQTVEEGDIVLSHSDQRFAAVPRRSDGFLYRAVRVPLGGDWRACGVESLAPTPITGRSAIRRPLKALFGAIAHGDGGLPDPATEIDHLARLALMACGRLPAAAPESRAALRTGLLALARATMRRHLRRAGLSPDMLAAELGISTRQVHVLFEPTGRSFARTLTGFRLEEAVRLLQAEPLRPIMEIGHACGFDSPATFYRAFRGAYSMAPGDMRAQAVRPASASRQDLRMIAAGTP